MYRWLWKSGKPRENEGEIRRQLADLEENVRRLNEGEAARELMLTNTLAQLQRLAGRVSKTLALDQPPDGKAKDVILLTPDDVISLARSRGLTR